MSRVDEIEARWAAATPGPWRPYLSVDTGRPGHGCWWVESDPGLLVSGNLGPEENPYSSANAAFIAAAPDDVKFLLARVRELEAGLAEYGAHKTGCPQRPHWTFVLDPACDPGPCDCGFAALAGES